MPPRPHLALPTPGSRRAVVVGAGSFGTATAVLLARGGFRTTLQTRTPEQAARLEADRENRAYLEGVALPRDLRIEPVSDGLARADYVFLGVPSRGLDEVIAGLTRAGLGRRTPVVSLAKGLVPPDGTAPTVLLSAALGYGRIACVGGPAHAREMVNDGAGLVAASLDERLASTIANVFLRAGVVCASSPATRSASSWRAWPRTPPRWPPAPRRPSASTRRARRPGTSSRRSGATPSARARARSR
jgi:glycerol-3-phosphate dehydrogenase (NAD(P)+)